MSRSRWRSPSRNRAAVPVERVDQDHSAQVFRVAFRIPRIPVRVAVVVNSLAAARAQVNQQARHFLARVRWRRVGDISPAHRLVLRGRGWVRWHRLRWGDRQVEVRLHRALVVESRWNGDNPAAAARAHAVVLEMRENIQRVRAALSPVARVADWLDLMALRDRVVAVARRVRDYLVVQAKATLSRAVVEIVGWALQPLAMAAWVPALARGWQKAGV